MKTLGTLAVWMVLSAVCAAAEEPTLEETQQTIGVGVDAILGAQKPDGSFVLIKMWAEHYRIGSTGLAVLALQHARPHVRGDQSARVNEAIKKGLAFITQARPEQMTYSAGFAILALVKEDPKGYAKPIGFYADYLAHNQHRSGQFAGMWGYTLKDPAGKAPAFVDGVGYNWGDRSNMQLALLALYTAGRAGYQVPREVWLLAREHYVRTQFANGGWSYSPNTDHGYGEPYFNITAASTVSLFLCDEMLLSAKHAQCVAPSGSETIEKGLRWVQTNWGKNIGGPAGGPIWPDTYGLYALERLGIIMGRANIGDKDWFREGSREIVARKQWASFMGTPEVSACFAVLFLSRGLEPIIINKLERKGASDWNNDPYEVKHLTEYISEKYQKPVQWRIVTLDAPVETLSRAPILYVSGHRKLELTDAEKAALRGFVKAGGTILGAACCAKKEFDESFRAAMSDTLGGTFARIPATHRLYVRIAGKEGVAGPKPEIWFLSEDAGQGRPLVIYLPHDVCCRWHTGGSEAKDAFSVGAGIYLYVANECRKMYLDSVEQKPDAPVEPPKQP